MPFGESVSTIDPDHDIRRAALEHVRALARHYDDLVPRAALLQGFTFADERWSLGSLQNGIYRPRRFTGPAAFTLLTAARSPGQPAPYDDDIDPASGTILYHYRAGSVDQADNRALRAALEFPRFRGHLTADMSGRPERMSFDAEGSAVFRAVQV